MAKYTDKLGKKIADAIEHDEYTLGEICSIHNISRKTFYQWIRKYTDFQEMVDNARYGRDERLAQKARQILKQRLEHGYSVTTTRYKYAMDDYGELSLIEKTETVKDYSADEKTLKIALAIERETESKIESRSVPFNFTEKNVQTGDQLSLFCNKSKDDLLEEELSRRINEIKREFAMRDPDPDSFVVESCT